MDLQAKVSLLLVAVIVPTFLVMSLVQYKLTQPILEEEMRQIGVTTAKTLAAEIAGGKLLSAPNPTPAIESRIQELLYSQPNLLRLDVITKDQTTGLAKLLASNVEDDPTSSPPTPVLVEALTSEFKQDDAGEGTWEIAAPIEAIRRDAKAPKKLLGTVHVVVSNKLVDRFIDTVARTTAMAAGFTVVALLLVLSTLLRKAIANDRLLRQAETQNLQLAEQLHDAQRQLMNTEKLAVMGQLTASFAHEIGTPLNAIDGHLQLLREEVTQHLGAPGLLERLGIINGQVTKIEEIVKGFLQSTAKPPSQSQLVDLNSLVERTLGIVRPRLEALDVEVQRHFDREMGPVRVVPLDLEQVLLNLVNNSLDSLQSKSSRRREDDRLKLDLTTGTTFEESKRWAVLSVYDTGEGIRKVDLKNVLKPFFTTKRPGEGTGLGLTICQQLAHKYGGNLEVDSKESAWTRVTLRFPI